MFIGDFDSDEVKKEASKLLKSWGVKHRLKKFDLKTIEKKESVGVFKTRLERLRQKRVKLQQYGQPVSVPAFVVESCNYIRDRIDTDGLFRKPGVAMRQKELKQILMSGGRLTADCDHNVMDVADLLKQFFRELPEPCIPYIFHDILQRCLENKEKYKKAILLALLLLPADYLYTLAYLTQFLQEVVAHQHNNRMDVCNLAIVWTPNLMPFKTGQINDKQVLDKRLTIVEVLIEHSSCIGVVPEYLYEQLPGYQPSCSSHDELESSGHREKKKKRRSGSLTRMISGIKKMVKSSSSEEPQPLQQTPECIPHTPCIMSTGKKRKHSQTNLQAFSAKKSLTRNCLMEEEEPKRRSRFYTGKSPERVEGRKSRNSGSRSRLRLSHFGLGKKHKKKVMASEDSGLELTMTPSSLDPNSSSEDYVRISRSEYEDIKSRVSRIESRISSEFENIIGVSMSDLEMTPDKMAVGNAKTVQSAYEKTLQSAGKLNSPTSDELARRFSRELKIRGSSEKKVIRSPSARKIGSLRRRSKENVPQIKRNLSLNVPDTSNSHHQFYPINGLRRGKPNTMCNGLPDPLIFSKDKSEADIRNYTNLLKSESFKFNRESFTFEPGDFELASFGVLTRSQTRRASSFHGCDLSKLPSSVPLSYNNINNKTPDDITNWKNAEDFLNDEKKVEKSVTGRPSVAKLRAQNAGMVLAKAKLFNTLVDGDNPHSEDYKIGKPADGKPRDIKKRNSSKSSKERKPQRQESRSKSKRENSVPNQPNESCGTASTKTDPLSRKENVGTRNGKENSSKCQIRSGQGLLPKTPQRADNTVQNRFKDKLNSASKPGKLSEQAISPLKERNRGNTPSGSRQQKSRQPDNKNSALGRSPKVAQHTPREGRTTVVKAVSSTPRRSPRQVILKSRPYLNH